MLPPHHRPVPDLARESQIPRDPPTAGAPRRSRRVVTWFRHRPPTSATALRSSPSSFVIETAHLNAEELSAYCRRQGIYPQQLEAWRSACIQANAPICGQAERAQRRLDQQRLKQLEQEVGRKDKALAAAAQSDRASVSGPGAVSGLGGDFLSGDEGRQPGAASRSGPASHPSPPGPPHGDRAQSGLELGYHLPGDDREGHVLLPLPVPGCLQP